MRCISVVRSGKTRPAVRLVMLVVLLSGAVPTAAQVFDTSWLDVTKSHVKIGVVADGVYHITGSQLAGKGVPLAQINAATFRLLENGKEIPALYTGAGSVMGSGDALIWVGKRNRGTDESWAYGDVAERQSSPYYSIYTDTTFYWLTWGGANGSRYAAPGAVSAPTAVSNVSQVKHVESDAIYFNGDGDAEISNPLYTRAEGYYMDRLRHSTTAPVLQTYEVAVPALARGGGASVAVRVQLNSETASGHRAVLEVEQVSGGGVAWVPVDSVAWIGYAFSKLEASVPVASIPTAADVVRLRVVSRNGVDVNPSAAPNSLLVDYVEVVATAGLRPTAGQTSFTAPGTGAYRFDVAAFTTSGAVRVLNPDRKIAWLVSSPSVTFDDNAVSGTTYHVSVSANLRAPVSVQLRAAGSIPALGDAQKSVDYLILTTPLLRASAEKLAEYRRSAQGGSYSVLIVETQAIFDVYDYGRRRSIAVRRFIKASRGWRRAPQFLMMWGDTEWPNRAKPQAVWETMSFGHSSSDGWYSMQLDGLDDWSEELSTGRIPARSNAEAELFVQKIKGYESQPPGDWNKRALILAGGAGEAQQSTLQYYSQGWGQTIANYPFGGDVTYYFKTADTVLDPTFRDSIEASIKYGASWLGYFGHSSATRWEIVTDPPDQFGNENVLPVALSLGCYNGAFGSSARVFAEDVVIKAMTGAIAHWGGTSSSFIGPAANIATPLYAIVFFEGERVLGKAITEAKRRFVSVGGSLTVATNLQYNLIGDPATRLNLPTKPELYVDDRSVSFEPFAPNLSDDSLTVSIRVNNRGLVTRDSVAVRVSHWAPDETLTTYTKKLSRLYLTGTIGFRIPINDEMVGDNRFLVVVDPDNAVDEGDEANNTFERTQIIFATGLSLVYPPDFAYVTRTDPTLRVSLSSQEQEGTPVIFQLDTVSTFDSSALVSETQVSSLAVEWAPNQPLSAGKTYFWRARVDDPTQPDLDWKAASFTVRTDLEGEGWFQQRRQFDTNTQGNFITHAEDGWAFKEFTSEYRLAHGREIVVGAEIYFRVNRGWGVILIDGNSGDIRQITLALDPTETYLAELEGLVQSAKPGDIILARNRTFFEAWGWTTDSPGMIRVKQAFASIGAQDILGLSFDQHWVMAAEVGGNIQEWVVPRAEEGTVRTVEYGFSFTESDSRSPLIGPARAWDRLAWTGKLTSPSALLAVDVLSLDGTLLLTDTLRYAETTKQIDLTGLDAATYPYLRLRAFFSDPSQSSTPQLLNWLVRYTAIPELIMDPGGFALSADTVAEGQQITASTTILNLSQADAVDVDVVYEVTDATNRTRVVGTDTLRSVGAHQRRESSLTFPTVGLAGLNRLSVTASQRGLKEMVTYNNLVVGAFVVRADKVPPTFRVLLDGEEFPDDPRPVTSLDDPTLPFINARPTIEVVVEDDSEYLPLADTSLVKLSLDGKRVGYDRSDVRFEPGTLQKNTARLVFSPDFSGADTTHTIQLWARDVSGNANPTELEPYQLHFRIQNDPDVETLYPYPNPMSTFTNFAFQLKGADPGLVEDFRIRVYTISGQLIREFDLMRDPGLLEGGSLRIGWNKVPWDGTDVDGHALASGVYLYKVFLRAEGKSIAVNNSSGIEKLVVIR